MWSVVAEQLVRNHIPVTTINELFDRIEAASVAVPVHVIQSVLDSMPKSIKTIIAARCDCSGYSFLRSYSSKFPENLIPYYF